MRLLGLALLLGCLMLVSCRSGSETLVPPVIESIHPTGIVGTPGDAIEFSAVVTGASGSATYAWTFGGGGNADDPTSPTPLVTLGSVDSYSGSLTVTDGESFDTAPFEFEVVNVPVIQSVSPTANAGLPLGEVQFTAEILGEPTEWQWSFRSGGAIPEDPTDESPVVTLQNPGTYEGELVATNSNGSSEAFPFEFTVAQPVAPTWTFVKVGTATASGVLGLNMALTNDKLVIAFTDAQERVSWVTIEPLKPELQALSTPYHMAGSDVTLRGTRFLLTSTDFTPRLVATGGEDSPSGVLKLFLATSTLPNDPSDWEQSAIQTGQTVEFDPVSLISIDHGLGVVFHVGSRLRFGVTETTDPTDPGDWTTHTLSDSSGILLHDVLQVGDHLYVAALRGAASGATLLDLYFTSAAPPTEQADWDSAPPLGFDSGFLFQPRLLAWDGLPVVVASSPPSRGQGETELYFLASSEPSTLAEWSPTRITPIGRSTHAFSTAAVAGRLAVLYADQSSGGLMVARQVGADPKLSASWESRSIADWNPGSDLPAGMIAIEGRLVIAFVDPADQVLTLAFADGPY